MKLFSLLFSKEECYLQNISPCDLRRACLYELEINVFTIYTLLVFYILILLKKDILDVQHLLKQND